MPRRVKALPVWLSDRHVATLEQRSWPAIRLGYTEEALDSWPQGSPVVSCGLRLQQRPQDALAFCKGLLPEGRALQTLADRAGVATNDTFALLERYGRDVAGALVLGHGQPSSREFDVQAYTVESLAAAVDDLDEHPLGVHEDSQLSLAGLQDKLLLARFEDGGWGRPLHGRPSTHILKVDDLRFPGLIEAEGDCLVLARAVGLTTVDVERIELADRPCLIVSRFDRVGDGNAVRRVHQEDLCQAVGVDPDAQRRRAKYERAGGPGFADAARLLDAHAADAPDQLNRLVAVVTFTVAIGNADAHGKNLALLHPTAEQVELAPLYDTVPTVLWPKLRSDAAMAVRGRWPLAEITLDDVAHEAVSWGHSGTRARGVAAVTVDQLLDALDRGVIDAKRPVAIAVRRRCEQLRAA